MDVQINGKSAGSVTCQAPVPTFAPSSAQPLPWSVVLLGRGGALATFQEASDNGPRTIFVRPGAVWEDSYGANPGPPPAATCTP